MEVKPVYKADLHCHSTFSDGTLSPKELIVLAKEKQIAALSITDHDTCAAYEESLYALANQMEVILIAGVEFSSVYRDRPVHILGYGFDPQHQGLQEFCMYHRQRREKRADEILDKLKKKGFSCSLSHLLDIHHVRGMLGRPHIAQAMVQKHFVSSIDEAFSSYLGEGKSCYVQSSLPSIEETISVIHRAGGIVFLAHPHLIRSKNTLKELMQASFDGIECYYARFPDQMNRQFVEMARSRGLLISGGSDFHGSCKPDLHLGCAWTDQESFTHILDRMKRAKDFP